MYIQIHKFINGNICTCTYTYVHIRVDISFKEKVGTRTHMQYLNIRTYVRIYIQNKLKYPFTYMNTYLPLWSLRGNPQGRSIETIERWIHMYVYTYSYVHILEHRRDKIKYMNTSMYTSVIPGEILRVHRFTSSGSLDGYLGHGGLCFRALRAVIITPVS